MMKVALPEWNGRISPVFDAAGRIVVVMIENDGESGRESHSLTETRPGPRAMRLSELGVSTLVCGAVSNEMARAVEAAGISIVPWVAGEIDEVIAAYIAGSLDAPAFRMPGCGGRRMRRGRGACGPGGRGGGGGAGRGGRGSMSGGRRRSE